MDPMFVAAGGGRPPKRQKTAVACNNCRSRKVRCGGETPFCGTCIARNETSTCAYPAPAPEITGKKTQEPNLRQHEAQIGDNQHLVNSATSQLTRNNQLVDWNGNPIARVRSPLSASPWNPGLSIAHQSPAQRSNQSVPASLSAGYLPKDQVGLTNSGGFLKTVLGAAPENGNESHVISRSRRQSPARVLADLGTVDCVQNPSLQSEDLLLPPRREVQRLLDVYQRVHYAILPLVDLPSFMADVSAAFDGVDPPASQQTLHCMLNFMFALAAQSQTSPQYHQKQDLVTPFFTRARNLMSIDLLDGWSFAQLQTILICAQFLLSTDRPQQCWLLVGLSIRIAEGLGLQRPSTALDLKSPVERALSRRVWHCCVVMDRTVAMCLGQAPTVGRYATSFVKLDVIKPGTDSTLVSDEETAHSFFKASSGLFDILHEILTMIYTADGKDPSEKILIPPSLPTTVIALEEKLDEWEKDLPSHLKVPADEQNSVNSLRLYPAHFLKQRYLQVCIMLYRPGLAARVLSQRDSFRASQRKLKQSTLFYSASACVQSAQTLISLCRKQAKASPESLMATPWWMNVLYAYTAATAIAAAMLDIELHNKHESPSLNDSMQDVFTLLTDYSSQHPIARRCISTLTSIIQPRNPPAPDRPGAVTSVEQPDQPPRPFLQTEAAHEGNHEMDFGDGIDFTIDDRHNPMFDFLTDQWLAQPQLDSFDFPGVQSLY